MPPALSILFLSFQSVAAEKRLSDYYLFIRAWCTFSKIKNGVEECEVFYIDYGNTATVPRDQLYVTNNDVWTVAMVAKPFKFTGEYA